MAKTKKTQEITEAVKKAVDAAEPVLEKAEAKTEETVESVKKVVEPAAKKVKKAVEPAMDAAGKEAKKAVKSVKKAASKVAEKKVFLQYQNGEFDIDDIVARATAVYNEIDGADVIRSMKIYVKPEDFAAYYVINDKDTGKIEL